MNNPLKLIALFFVLTITLHAQTGRITGNVLDKKNGELLTGVTVKLEGTTTGAITDLDGKYVIKDLAPGSYTLVISYISYKTVVIKDVQVTADKTTTIDATMDDDVTEIGEVVVIDSKVTNTETSVIMEMKQSNNIVSATSAAQISKSQDRDAADVVKRIPGVTVIENRFIMVRGLTDRYNSVWLNDAGAPSAETDRKSFSFDIIPSGLIDRILIYKTPSPELPGDFAGGMVKLYTKAMPEKNSFVVNVQGSYRANTTGKDFYSTDGSKTDKFGYDNGFRALPAGTPDTVSKYNPNINSITKAFKNTWGIHDTKAAPDMRANIVFTRLLKREKFRLGNTTALNYSNIRTVYNIRRQDWDSVSQQVDYADVQSTNTVRSSAIENISFMTKNHKLEFRNLFNQTGKSQTTIRNSNFLDGPNERSYLMSYEDKTTLSSQLSGSHKTNNSKTQYDWTLGYAYNRKRIPDLRRIKYTKSRLAPDSMYKAPVANVVDPVNGGGRFFSTLKEQVYSFSHNLKHTFSIKKYSFDINLGNYVEYKSRTFAARVLGYTIKPGFTAFNLTRQDVGSIFSDANVGTKDGFKLDEITSPSDKYWAQNKLLASYISGSFPIGKSIKINGGVRYEYNVQSLQSHVNLDSISPSITTKFFLPSVNASFNFTEKSLLRVAYGKTLNRPEFREWSPFYFYDFDLFAGTYGSLFPTVLNPSGAPLKVAEIQNYDLRYEFYPSAGEYVQVGLFYKDFKNPIQQVILNSGGSDSRAFTFVNADKAYAEGIEIDTRKNLGFIDNVFKSNFFKNFNMIANLSLIKSQVTISKVINQSTTSPLQGQSPYVINAGIYYQNDSTGTQISLLYNVFGSRVYLLGTLDYANIGEVSRNTLDLTVTQRINKYFSVTASAQNILNPKVLFVQDTDRNNKFEPKKGNDKEMISYRMGAYYSLGITFRF